MRTVPRHRFIPEEYRNQAYDDTPVLIGEGQTISQPIVVDIMTSNHDGYYGWEENAPYDRIIVTAAPDHIPQPLLDQLKDGGIMVVPVGPPGWNQVLWKITKVNGEIRTTIIADVVVFLELTRAVSSNNN